MHPHNTIDVCVYSLQHQFPGSLHYHPDLPHSRLCQLERTKKSKHFSTYNIFHAVQDEHKQYLSQLWTLLLKVHLSAGHATTHKHVVAHSLNSSHNTVSTLIDMSVLF